MEKVETGEEVFADSDRIPSSLTDSDNLAGLLENVSLSDKIRVVKMAYPARVNYLKNFSSFIFFFNFEVFYQFCYYYFNFQILKKFSLDKDFNNLLEKIERKNNCENFVKISKLKK